MDTILFDRFKCQLERFDQSALIFLVDGYKAAWELEVGRLIEHELPFNPADLHFCFRDAFTIEQYRDACMSVFLREGRDLLDADEDPEWKRVLDRELVQKVGLDRGMVLEQYGVSKEDLRFYRASTRHRDRR